jgi:putative transcriptional regulator
MIRCTLGTYMKEKGLSNKEVVQKTGVSRNTVSSLAGNSTKRIDYDTLNALCEGLNLKPADLLVYEFTNEK